MLENSLTINKLLIVNNENYQLKEQLIPEAFNLSMVDQFSGNSVWHSKL